MGLAPGFHYIEQGGRRLSVRQVEQYARKYGLPAHGIAQIARGESSLYPYVQQHDPGDGMVGYGILQLTPNAWGSGSRASKLLNHLGGISALKSLDNQFRIARVLYHDAGNSFKPWYGTRYLNDRTGEGSLGRIRGGMQVGGGGPGGGAGAAQALSAGPLPDRADGSGGALALLSALQGQQGPSQPQSAGLAAPSFSAAPALPQGAQAALSSGGPQPKTDPASLIAAVQASQSTDLPSLTGGGGGQPSSGGQPQGGGQLGKVTVASTANRAGVPLGGDVLKFVRGVAGLYGHRLTIGTGTNHDRLTINGTESDHWRGEAADIPLAGSALIKAGQAALIRAGMSPKKAHRINGGGFNVGGWQVIFNTNAPGWGDHTDHLHVGRRR